MSLVTYSVVDALIWSMLEPALGVTLACVPLLRPIFSKFFPDSSSTKNSNGTYGSTSSSGTGPKSSRTSKNLDTKRFQKLDEHEYPLHTLGDSDVVSSEAVSYNRPNSVISLPDHTPKQTRQSSLSQINVKREWTVESSRE